MADDNTITIKAEKKQRSLDNLKPFKKGQSGNPKGLKKGTVSIVAGIKRKLMQLEPGTKKVYLDLFLSKYFQKAIRDGNVALMKDFIDRIDGRPDNSNSQVNVQVNVSPILGELKAE